MMSLRLSTAVWRVPLMAVGVLVVATVGAALTGGDADPVTGDAGPVTVTVDVHGGVVDGQLVSIHAKANTGELYEIRAHICSADVPIKNTFNFGPDGGHCSPTPLVPGSDAETITVVPPGSNAGDLTFRLGSGTATWTSFSPLDPPEGGAHTLTCGQGARCSLVIQLQVTDNTVFYTVPLCWGCPVDPPAERSRPGRGAGLLVDRQRCRPERRRCGCEPPHG